MARAGWKFIDTDQLSIQAGWFLNTKLKLFKTKLKDNSLGGFCDEVSLDNLRKTWDGLDFGHRVVCSENGNLMNKIKLVEQGLVTAILNKITV